MKLEDHLAPFFLGGSPTIEQIANEHPDLIAELKRLEPIKTATTFAGLLTLPKLQANCLRIEVLVHLAAAYCEGRSAPTKGLTKRSFERLGDGYCGRMEDPAEDVFLTLVNTPRGNFRIFDGIREGTGFYLQRILNVVESMPHSPTYDRIRSTIDCLLKLSDAVATRAGLPENSLGGELPHHTLPTDIAKRLSSARSLIRFNEDDLARLQPQRSSWLTSLSILRLELVCPRSQSDLPHLKDDRSLFTASMLTFSCRRPSGRLLEGSLSGGSFQGKWVTHSSARLLMSLRSSFARH